MENGRSRFAEKYLAYVQLHANLVAMVTSGEVEKAFWDAMSLRAAKKKAEVVVTAKSGFSIVVSRYRIVKSKRNKGHIIAFTKSGFLVRNPIKVFVREGTQDDSSLRSQGQSA